MEYVGNKGYRLLSFNDINAGLPGASRCLNAAALAGTGPQSLDACGPNAIGPNGTINPACVAAKNCSANPLALQEARPFYNKFPYLGFINFANNLSHSRYDSLQVSVTKRMSHGLSFNAGYTYGHGLDNGSLNRFSNSPQDANNIAGEYANSDFDIRNRFTFTATYDIPGIKGFGQLLEGWEINGIVNYETAQPWLAFDAGSDFSATGEFADRWNIKGPASNFVSGKESIPFCSGFPATPTCSVATIYGPIAAPSAVTPSLCTAAAADLNTLATAGCYVSPNGQSVLTPPAIGHFGDMGRNIFRDSGYKNLDFSVFKNFTFKERFHAQFRVEVFNVFNHPLAANPYGASSAVNAGDTLNGGLGFGAAGQTPDFAAGNPLIGSGSQRDMQLGLKLSF